ncbi:MAG: hypothetical protein JNL51_14265 [Chitinophagaceae bacterium]|nr:hypothetical protein [Chitinophagaceae bacterium]
MKKNLFRLMEQGYRTLRIISVSVWPVAPKKLEPVKIVSPTRYSVGSQGKEQP